VSVVSNSLKVNVVTTITTEKGTMTQNTQSYSTSKTKGVSLARTDTQTWNKWVEVSQSKTTVGRVNWGKMAWSAGGIIGGVGIFALGTGACATVGGCFVGAAGMAFGGSMAWEGTKGFWDSIWEEDPSKKTEYEKQTLDKMNENTGAIKFQTTQSVTNTTNITNQMEKDTTRLVNAQNMTTYSVDRLGNITANGFRDVTNALLAPRYTNTKTNGQSQGGAVSLTQSEYEENSVTNGESLTTGEDWRTATAMNSAHAADLKFTYMVRNAGTDYATSLSDIAFNVYLNDDTNPIYTYFVGPDLGGDGKLHNIQPTTPEEAANSIDNSKVRIITTSRPIPLTLDELQALDVDPECALQKATNQIPASQRCPGGRLRVEPAGFTFDGQENYQGAIDAGVTLQIDDGSDDGNSTLDIYLVPTWTDSNNNPESFLNVVARTFPMERDASGSLIAIWTPEIRTDTPAWCDAPKRFAGTVYCRRALSTADAWLMYSSGMGGDTTAYQNMTAQRGARALLRFRRDSDRDGYPDDVERQLGTNPNDANSKPVPELTGGVASKRSGNSVTNTLSLLNTAPSDAYGVEAVMIAPDDSISVTNNSVGGGGRVRSYRQLAVGSRIEIKPGLTSDWLADGHAVPAISGYYTGNATRTYAFSTVCGAGTSCVVGQGSVFLAWSDSQGISGTVSLGSTYRSPIALTIGNDGLKVAMMGGTLTHGQQFSVETAPPADTFQYTINREPYTQPLVAVTTNHTGGWYQSVVPSGSMNLSDPNESLTPYIGNMIYGMDTQILSNAAVVTGTNTTYVAVNNPTTTTIKNGNVYLEVVSPTGYRTASFSQQLDFVPGPSVVPITW